jgi:hypothetical protein
VRITGYNSEGMPVRTCAKKFAADMATSSEANTDPAALQERHATPACEYIIAAGPINRSTGRYDDEEVFLNCDLGDGPWSALRHPLSNRGRRTQRTATLNCAFGERRCWVGDKVRCAAEKREGAFTVTHIESANRTAVGWPHVKSKTAAVMRPFCFQGVCSDEGLTERVDMGAPKRRRTVAANIYFDRSAPAL